MFSRSIQKTVQPHLHDGEALLAAVLAQATGASTQLLAHALSATGVALRADRATFDAHARATATAEAAGVELDRRMVVAVTGRRLLIFKAGGAFTVETRGLVKPVTVHSGGAAITFETARGQRAEALVEALERAHAAAAVAR